jgi:two-component system NtrC family sensor kinase
LKEGGVELAEEVYLKIIPIPKAKPTERVEETSGMALISAVPVYSSTGEFIGIIYGGKLLNRHYLIVDKIKDVVFQGEVYKGKDIGTATIFQNDLRISTNVRTSDGERAIGTIIAANVYDKVLGMGESYYDRAFVVNNWYLTAYEPIKDITRKVIGILYVGILEEKYTDMRKRAITTFLAIVLIGMGSAIAVSHYLSRTILKPLNAMVYASRQIAKGNLNYRVKDSTGDELGELGSAFNTMASSLRERDEQLKEYTRQQIMRSERLATLGQLSAGVAHEINNPLTGVLTYVRLIKKRLDKRGDEDGDFRRYLDKVEKETERCSTIVKNLLDFARQSEPNLKSVDINLIINESLDLLEHKIRLQNVEVEKGFGSVPRLTADFAQLQQVFMNLIINAVEAMDKGGKLIISTKVLNELKMVEIDFIDTGVGIPKENLSQIFDPFFTTKTKGTGLGLSVVFGIISRHKGEIDVKSDVGKGTIFTIRLPIDTT